MNMKRDIMDITKAYEILNRYYPKNQLQMLCQNKKFDGSETDSIRKLHYYAELLKQEAHKMKDDGKVDLYSAAEVFESLAVEQEYNR